jgi:uncharacterized short protein YbdD (DUF466 family)
MNWLVEAIKNWWRFKPKPSNDPVVEARQAIYKRRLPEDLSDFTVYLADYENQSTLHFLKPDIRWTIAFYREYIREYARQIRKRQGQAVICMVYLQEYLNWLRREKQRHHPKHLETFVEQLGKKRR